MSTISYLPHVTVDADGTARIGQTRYKVVHLAGEHYHYGWSAEEILRQHPDLRPEQVYAAMTYFYDHYDSLVRELREPVADSESLAQKPPISRAELLGRRAARGG